MKLICFDMDGVIFKDFNFWMEVHRTFGTLEEGKVLTAKYLNTDYQRLVHEVVEKLWKGKDAAPYYELVGSLEYLDGVEETMKFVHSSNWKTAIVSGSSIDCAKRVQNDYGIDHIFANTLVIRNGKVSGEFDWPIGTGLEKKAEVIRGLCRDLGIGLDEVLYIGDSDKDIEAFKEVGVSVAFNSDCQELKDVATHVVDSNDLSDVIPILEKYTT